MVCGDCSRPDSPASAEARGWLLLYPRLAAFCRLVQRRTSLSMTEIAVLCALHETGASEMRDLRRAVAADAGHLSRILAAFEQADMVVRESSDGDGRVRRVALTALGAERCLAVSCAAAEIAREISASHA